MNPKTFALTTAAILLGLAASSFVKSFGSNKGLLR